jgi:predicted Fe-Mo cluster-binding NifX family protein
VQKCDLRAAPQAPKVLEASFLGYGAPLILLDVLLPEEVMEKVLGATPVGINPCTVAILFEEFNTIRSLLAAPEYHQHLVSGRLKLWHRSEWTSCLETCFSKNLRSSLLSCKNVLGPGEEVPEALDQLQGYQSRYIEIVEDYRKEATEYYQSEEYRQRQEKIAQGHPPRILVEQGCHTVATKQFSRNAAKALRNLDCEVYQHPNCGPDSIDFVIANIIEVARFKPDLVIRPPNQFGTVEDIQQRKEWKNLPILTALQDLDPHLFFPKYLKMHPPRKCDLVLLLQHRFRKELEKEGLDPSQILCEYIPCELTSPAGKVEPLYDVGFVKTLSPVRTIKDRLLQDNVEPPAEVEALDRAIVESVAKGPPLDVYQLRDLATKPGVANVLYIAYHEELCTYFAEALYSGDVAPALYGQNWDRILPDCAKGHLHSRERYMAQFLENRINLSINPWNEFHSRIFDGGSIGAFFLVYRVDPSVRWQALPAELQAGEHFDYFSTKEELIEKCRYYQANPEERIRIGKNLQKVLLEHYTYEATMQRFLDALQAVCKKGESRRAARR